MYTNKQIKQLDDLRWKISEAALLAVRANRDGLCKKTLADDLARLSRLVDDAVYDLCQKKGVKYE